jgi:hypothetical protein
MGLRKLQKKQTKLRKEMLKKELKKTNLYPAISIPIVKTENVTGFCKLFGKKSVTKKINVR